MVMFSGATPMQWLMKPHVQRQHPHAWWLNPSIQWWKSPVSTSFQPLFWNCLILMFHALKKWETGETPTISCSNHPILLVKFQFSPLKSQAPDDSIAASVAPWPCVAGAMLASSCGAADAVLRASEGATGASSAYGSDGSWEFCRLIPQRSFPMEHWEFWWKMEVISHTYTIIYI